MTISSRATLFALDTTRLSDGYLQEENGSSTKDSAHSDGSSLHGLGDTSSGHGGRSGGTTSRLSGLGGKRSASGGLTRCEGSFGSGAGAREGDGTGGGIGVGNGCVVRVEDTAWIVSSNVQLQRGELSTYASITWTTPLAMRTSGVVTRAPLT